MKEYTKTITITEPRLIIRYEICPDSPREWSNLGYFISVDRRYKSPDNNEQLIKIVGETGKYAKDLENHKKLITERIEKEMEEKVLAIFPVCKYEHSGISYAIGTIFGFDYSNNGFYIITDKTQKEVGAEEKDFEKIAENEIATYNQYVNGEVYCCTLYNEKGEEDVVVSGIYDIEDIREYLDDSWEDEDLNDYLV